MIRHVVMFKFLPEADGRTKTENVAMTAERLRALPATIPEILHSEVHIGAPEAADTNCDLLLISDFESFETLASYLCHPDHKAIGAFMRPLRESRAAVDFTL
ncbi:MAG: Dabb family protein [Clostridia bacterium]|nr:Dabb family protein [Clostridia bacterium]